MLSDRSYMQNEYPRQSNAVLTWIVSAMIAGFVVQYVSERFGGNMFESLTALGPGQLRHGYLWTLVTYTLLHANVIHLLVNVLGIFLLGRELVSLLGLRAFVGVYLAAAAVGGMAWMGVHYFIGGTVLVGASSCLMALFILFACFYPDREIMFLLFFVLPIRVKPKHLAWGLVGVDLLGFVLGELLGGSLDRGIAHSAHLGGALTAWIYFRYVHAANGWDRAPGFSLTAWLGKRMGPRAAAKPSSRNPAVNSAELRAEVDRILDKINSRGFGALTDDEKRILDEAKDMLSRP